MIIKFSIFETYRPSQEEIETIYSNELSDRMNFFISWFYLVYGDLMKRQYWLIANTNRNGQHDVWEIERNDFFEQVDISVEELIKLGEKTGLILDPDGVIIGYDGVKFFDHPEYLDTFKEKLEQEKKAKQFGL